MSSNGQHHTNGSNGNGHAKIPQLSAKVEMVTPEMASRLLGTMPHNRHMRRRLVERYAREMVAGKWHLNGEPLIIGHDGSLRDGQHRLNAVVMAKVAVPMLVVRGIHAEAMATIDTGASRNFADVMTLSGGSAQGAQMGAVARLWWAYENTDSVSTRVNLSHQEIMAVLERHPIIEEAAARAGRSSFRRHCPQSVMGFVFGFLCENEDPEIAELFLSTVEKGANLDDDDPIFALRRVLIDLERRDSRLILALVIKAYNEWIDGEKLELLMWRSGERFPRFGKPSKDARRTRKAKRARATA